MDDLEGTTVAATVIGYNELARKAVTLGERVFYRMARDRFVEMFNAKHGTLTLTEDEAPVLTIHGQATTVAFYPRDIELMRKAVADFDAGAERG